MTEPSIRKPLGVLFILAFITLWCIGVVALSAWIGALHWAGQAAVYLVLGVVWIAPLKPVLRWMEGGR